MTSLNEIYDVSFILNATHSDFKKGLQFNEKLMLDNRRLELIQLLTMKSKRFDICDIY